MNPFQSSDSGAQFAEKFLTRTAVGVFLMAIAYSASAALYLVDGELAIWLDRLELLLALAAVAIVLPMFVQFVRLQAARRGDCEPEGFVTEVFRKACVKAFSLTFGTLGIL